jgi:hypothetical protein
MMRAALRPVTFGVLLLALTARPASAGLGDWLGWLEGMSGPGPFHGPTVSIDRLACWSEPAGGGRIERVGFVDRSDPCRNGADRQRRRVRAYLSVELARFRSSRNVLARDPEADEAQVDLTRLNALVFARVAQGLEVGGGLGINRFSGEGATGEDFGFTRLTLPLRVRVRPGMWVAPESRWSRLVHFNVGFDRLPSTFTAADFGQQGPFREEGESLATAYIGFDVLSVLK